MPAVKKRKKSTAGKDLTCGNCGTKIEAGQEYFFWSFRYGGRQIRCSNHYPKQSELTQSKLGTIYSAIEDAEDTIAKADAIDDIVAAVQSVAETVNEVVEEYREAAEHFGGQGENAERADELEGFASDLEGWEAEDIEEADHETIEEQAADELKREGYDDGDEVQWVSLLQERVDSLNAEFEDGNDERLEEVRTQAQDKLGEMPL